MNPSLFRSKLIFSAAAMVTCVMGCASPIALEAGPKTPAAAGSVKVSHDSQGNTKIDLTVNYLPEPFDLDRSLTTFVVWSVADDGNRVRNLGQLQVDGHRHGSVDLVTPLSTFKLLVTAEQSGTAEKPSDYLILQGKIPAGS